MPHGSVVIAGYASTAKGGFQAVFSSVKTSGLGAAAVVGLPHLDRSGRPDVQECWRSAHFFPKSVSAGKPVRT
jgi:hypothetical protein